MRTARIATLGLLLAVLACTASPPARPAANERRSDESSPSGAAAAPVPPMHLRVAYSAVWGANAVAWTAYEAGIFAQHGLDVELTLISSAQSISATIANEVAPSFGGGYAAIASRLGGSDLLIFFNVTNWWPYELMVTPDINTGADLKDKRLGVSRFGSASDTATRVALRKLGLAPERDVVLIQTGGLSERIAAMKAGSVAGGVAAPPDNLVLRREGFKTLLDLSASSDPELTNVAFATAAWLDANPATAQAFTDALVEGIHFTKTHREATEQALGKYLKLDDPEQIAVAYDYWVTQRQDRLPDLST